VVWFKLADRAELHVYAETDLDHSFFGDGPVPGLLVDDFLAAVERLTTHGVQWLTVPDPLATTESVRSQDYPKPITGGYKLEGCWWGTRDRCVYFVSSFARPANGAVGTHDGQVWRHDPKARTITLEVIFLGSPIADDVFEEPDNICVSPYGGLMMCEDSGGENYLLGTTRDGEPFTFARNRQQTKPGETGELSGVSFSPGGRVLYFNVSAPGTTFAVTGPWNRQRR